jgi:hypothetical protein
VATQRPTQTAPQAAAKATGQAYVLEGTVMEACNCGVLCPCCAGENPDNGTCDSVLAYHIDRGQINGVDVGNLTVVAVVHSPGNMYQGNWKRALVFDKKASHEQSVALTEAFEGRLGGPLSDLAQLVKERADITWAPMEYTTSSGKSSSVSSGDQIRATSTSIQSRTGKPLTLSQTMFTTEQASPAQVGKTTELRVNLGGQGMSFTFKGTHAAQGQFRFEA